MGSRASAARSEANDYATFGRRRSFLLRPPLLFSSARERAFFFLGAAGVPQPPPISAVRRLPSLKARRGTSLRRYAHLFPFVGALVIRLSPSAATPHPGCPARVSRETLCSVPSHVLLGLVALVFWRLWLSCPTSFLRTVLACLTLGRVSSMGAQRKVFVLRTRGWQATASQRTCPRFDDAPVSSFGAAEPSTGVRSGARCPRFLCRAKTGGLRACRWVAWRGSAGSTQGQPLRSGSRVRGCHPGGARSSGHELV